MKGTNDVLNDYLFGGSRSYDKYGVLQEVVALVQRGEINEDDEEALRTNVFSLCEELRRAVSTSQQAARRESGKQAVKRLIDDFFKQNRNSSSVFNMQLLLERIQRDLQLLGEDGELLDGAIRRLLAELRKLRSGGHYQLQDGLWSSWSGALAAMRMNPLHFFIRIDGGVPTPMAELKEEAVGHETPKDGPPKERVTAKSAAQPVKEPKTE